MSNAVCETYRFNIASIDWINTGGNCMVAVAKCDLTSHVGTDTIENSVWFGVCNESFVVYSDYPFDENYTDDMVIADYYLEDCQIIGDHGIGYDFGEWDKLGNLMMDLYYFLDDSRGTLNER